MEDMGISISFIQSGGGAFLSPIPPVWIIYLCESQAISSSLGRVNQGLPLFYPNLLSEGLSMEDSGNFRLFVQKFISYVLERFLNMLHVRPQSSFLTFAVFHLVQFPVAICAYRHLYIKFRSEGFRRRMVLRVGLFSAYPAFRIFLYHFLYFVRNLHEFNLYVQVPNILLVCSVRRNLEIKIAD